MCQELIRIIVRGLSVRVSGAGFGHSVAEQCLLIETGNMLIMTYAYARASGDGNLIARYVRQQL